MLSRQAQGSRNKVGRHLVLYDGSCGLCHGLVRNVLQHDRLGVFHFASLQSATAADRLARFSDCPSDLSTAVVIVNYRGEPSAKLTRASAAIFVLTVLGWPWKTAALLRLLPIALLDRTYDLIARNRDRILGRRDRCLAPRLEYQRRFVEPAGDVMQKPEVLQ
jgi:predicted DCC family thiol-disulfide oxidoreductase YuxK